MILQTIDTDVQIQNDDRPAEVAPSARRSCRAAIRSRGLAGNYRGEWLALVEVQRPAEPRGRLLNWGGGPRSSGHAYIDDGQSNVRAALVVTDGVAKGVDDFGVPVA